MMTTFRLILLVGLIVCAAATALTKKPMQAVIIYMAYSVIMSVIWIMLESPDLAITEAAVGAGITSLLLFLTLRRHNAAHRERPPLSWRASPAPAWRTSPPGRPASGALRAY